MAVLFQFGGFQQIIQNMQQMGFFQFLFPFLLALAIIYGLLNWALKDRFTKAANGLISIIIAFFVMLYSSWNVAIVAFFANISGYFLIVGSGLLFVVLLLAIFGIKTSDIVTGNAKWVFILLIIFIGALIFFGAGGDLLIGTPSWATNSDFWTILFFIIILALVMWFFGKEGGGGSAPSGPPTSKPT